MSEPWSTVRCWRANTRSRRRKVAWRSSLAAEMYAAWLLEHGGRPQSAYRCPWCNWWHLTSVPVANPAWPKRFKRFNLRPTPSA